MRDSYRSKKDVPPSYSSFKDKVFANKKTEFKQLLISIEESSLKSEDKLILLEDLVRGFSSLIVVNKTLK